MPPGNAKLREEMIDKIIQLSRPSHAGRFRNYLTTLTERQLAAKLRELESEPPTSQFITSDEFYQKFFHA